MRSYSTSRYSVTATPEITSTKSREDQREDSCENKEGHRVKNIKNDSLNLASCVLMNQVACVIYAPSKMSFESIASQAVSKISIYWSLASGEFVKD